jgi:hypothetical protein
VSPRGDDATPIASFAERGASFDWECAFVDQRRASFVVERREPFDGPRASFALRTGSIKSPTGDFAVRRGAPIRDVASSEPRCASSEPRRASSDGRRVPSQLRRADLGRVRGHFDPAAGSSQRDRDVLRAKNHRARYELCPLIRTNCDVLT